MLVSHVDVVVKKRCIVVFIRTIVVEEFAEEVRYFVGVST